MPTSEVGLVTAVSLAPAESSPAADTVVATQNSRLACSYGVWVTGRADEEQRDGRVAAPLVDVTSRGTGEIGRRLPLPVVADRLELDRRLQRWGWRGEL